jgi:hypothetical protein
MGNKSVLGFCVQETERWHRCVRDAFLQNLQDRSIGKLPYFEARHDVRCTLPAFAVECVASGAIRGVSLFANRCICGLSSRISGSRGFALAQRVNPTNQKHSSSEQGQRQVYV